jgi:hypothetical protein
VLYVLRYSVNAAFALIACTWLRVSTWLDGVAGVLRRTLPFACCHCVATLLPLTKPGTNILQHMRRLDDAGYML